MKVSSETLENRQARLTIEVAPEEMEGSLDKAYRRLAQKIAIPGFRKGKAPRSILEAYLGKEVVLEEALEDIIPETYRKALEEKGLVTVAQPEIEIVERQPVKYKATIHLSPTIDLGDYRHIRLIPEKAEVTQEEVDRVIEQLRKQHAPWIPIEGPVAFDDLVTMDVKCTASDEAILNQCDIQYAVIKDSPRPVPGFAEKLENIAKGETREFNLPFPEDYPDKKMLGKEAYFKVTVSEIKRKALPELNVEFVKSLGEGFENMDALRQRITQQLQNIAEDTARHRFEEKAMDSAVGLAKVQYPLVMLEQELKHLLEEQTRQIGQRALDEYLKNVNKSGEQLKEEMKPTATARLVRSLVLGKIAEEEKIEVSNQDVETEIERLTQAAGQHANEARRSLSTTEGWSSLAQRLLIKKTLERLARIASGQAAGEVPASAEASQAEEIGEAGH